MFWKRDSSQSPLSYFLFLCAVFVCRRFCTRRVMHPLERGLVQEVAPEQGVHSIEVSTEDQRHDLPGKAWGKASSTDIDSFSLLLPSLTPSPLSVAIY